MSVLPTSAQGRDVEIAALSPESALQVCTDSVDRGSREPVRELEACTSVIESKNAAAVDLANARLARGLAETRLGKPGDANADYREATNLYGTVIDPREPNPVFTFRRAVAYHALGQVDLALADYGTTIRWQPRSVDAFLNRGTLLVIYKGELRLALADFDQAVALVPNDAAALALRGDTLAALGEFGLALADLNRAIALKPDNPRLYVLRALARGKQNEIQLAFADYERALGLDPANVEALVNRATLKVGLGDNGGAIADLDRALTVQPSNAVALYDRGFSRFARNEYEQAIADYSAAIAIDPTFGLAFNNRCLSRVVAGLELEKASADCSRALELMPGRADVRETQGFVHLKLNEPEQALAQYIAALEIDARRPLALYGRGIAKERLGDASGAEIDERNAIAINPGVARNFSDFGVH